MTRKQAKQIKKVYKEFGVDSSVRLDPVLVEQMNGMAKEIIRLRSILKYGRKTLWFKKFPDVNMVPEVDIPFS